MKDDFEIEFQDNQLQPDSSVQLPMNILSIGEIENDDVKVYIKQDVYKALEKYALEDVEHERGTIILGDYCEELGNTHVIISNYIEAKYTDASASTLTFTHETWDYVHKQQDKLYPDKKIVGWQHTHPSYGIFLSNYDLFIHENFFNLPFQVAYVIDPIQNLRGFFQWKNGQIEKLNGFYIYDDVGKPIKIEQVKKKTIEQNQKSTSRIPIILLALLCVCTVALAAMLVNLNSKIKAQQEQQANLQQVIAGQDASIKSLQSELEENADATDNNDNPDQIEPGTTIEELLELINNQQIRIDNQQELIEQLQARLDEEPTGTEKTMMVFTSYTVKPGDTLGKICREFGIDYASNINLIKSLNGIEDVNLIFVGQAILLPIQEIN